MSAVACRLCGKGPLEIGGWLERTNPLGELGVWECHPSCNAQRSEEDKLMDAIDGAAQPEKEKR
jgi:hypothetical protein